MFCAIFLLTHNVFLILELFGALVLKQGLYDKYTASVALLALCWDFI